MSSSPRAVAPGSRVLSAEHAATLPLASFAARAPALPQAPCEEEEAEARAEELRLAFEAGRRAGLEEATTVAAETRAQLLAETAKHLVNAAAMVATNRRQLLDDLVGDSADLVFGLLEQLLATELELRPHATREAVVRALQLAPPDEDLIVRVHPDAGLSERDFADLLVGAAITIREDPSIERNGAVVEVGACRIDAQVGPALERVRTALGETLAGLRSEV